jgi:hypothetical protein
MAMADLDNAPGAGDLTLELGSGDIVTLKCTANAAIRLARLPGGLIDIDHPDANTVHRRVMRFDIETMCQVIRIGCGAGDNADRNLPQKAYDYGLPRLRAELDVWIGSLLSGGKPVATQAAPNLAPKEEVDEGDSPLGKATSA